MTTICNNTKNLNLDDFCTGCASCANKCPFGAIKIIQDKHGFYKPSVDKEKCTNCSICEKTCPQLNSPVKRKYSPKCYALMAQDDIRLKSSSGGVFTLIAEEILACGGVVCGAAFNKNWQVEHIIVDNKDDLEKLRGSKYIQSYISENLFKEIKTHLEQNKYVLFSGVPCQVAGLLNYLGKKYKKLYTIDLICAYCPSPKVFKKFFDETYAHDTVLNIKFRDKVMRPWGCGFTTTTTTTTTKESPLYMDYYLKGTFKGEHCANCNYKKFPRPADFTIGDFWRIDSFTSGMNDKKGTSGLLLNTLKAQALFKKIRPKFKKLKEMPLNTLGWQIDVKNKIHRTPACREFFKHLDDKSFRLNVLDAHRNTTVGILNWWFINNRGAILLNYALNEVVKELGYSPLTVNYISPFERKAFEQEGYVKNFTDKYIRRTGWVKNREELKTLNRDIYTFICGSDQIFNYFPCKAHGLIYYLSWADCVNNKLISYGASFADRNFTSTEKQKNFVQFLLKRFDYHSIREQAGVDIMKNTFGINSVRVLDPVFLIDKAKYLQMADNSKNKIKGDFIVTYFTNPKFQSNKAVEHLKKARGGD